jgi:hypothetical protein
VEGTLAGLAEFFFARGGAVGFGFAVGHGRWEFDVLSERDVLVVPRRIALPRDCPTHAKTA